MPTTHTTSTGGTTLALHYELPSTGSDAAVLFVHGATFGARPAFATLGYSWLTACSARGRSAYAVDHQEIR